MKTMKDLEKRLRKLDYRQAKLYLFCNFVAVMLITAYSVMLLSPTVLEVFPVGGDSRKQMMAIFVLALVGCVAFTIYATALFFRKKARQLGILMAFGISKRKLAPMLYREVMVLSFLSSICGVPAGIVLVALLWNGFRLMIVDSSQMELNMRLAGLGIPAAFVLTVIVLACVTAERYLARTDILDTIQEEHKNEPVKELGRWSGPAGIVILLAGAVTGYCAPAVYMEIAHKYPVWWLNLFYVPVFIGLYMILLHTVVHGWSFRKRKPRHPRKPGSSAKQKSSSLRSNLISYSMMKFQGKQTVNNMLVSTVLTAGACFAIFYLPMFVTNMTGTFKNRPYEYLYHYRADQSGLTKTETENLAAEYGVSLKDWHETDYINLGMDGVTDVGEGGDIVYEYRELIQEGKFFSESGFRELTGEDVHVERGTYLAVTNNEETAMLSTNCKIFTNMDTRRTISVHECNYVHCNMLADEKGYYVLNDADYAEIAQGISKIWSGKMCAFNVEGEDSYPFADHFFREHVKTFDESCNIAGYYDRVQKTVENEQGKDYWGEEEERLNMDESHLNDADFRIFWEYMPKILILETTDFMRTFAVFLMMFLFIFLICITAACVICYTRCRTIALNNRYVFDNLRKLGAPPAFLKKEIKKQCCTVIRTPAVIGIAAMSLLYTMIMFGNDGKITMSEVTGLGRCGLVIAGIAVLLYVIYRKTVKILVKELVDTQ